MFSIRYVLPLLIVTPIITAVGVTNWLSLRSSQQAVQTLAKQLSGEVSAHIKLHMKTYFDVPKLVNEVSEVALVSQPELAVERISNYFWELHQRSPLVPHIFFTSQTGRHVGVERRENGAVLWLYDESTDPNLNIYSLDEQGNRGELLESKPFEPALPPGVEEALAGEELVWSDVFLSPERQTLAMASVLPVFTEDGSLLGILEIEILLAEISEFLQELEISDSGEAVVLIMEPSGDIVASSLAESVSGEAEKQRLNVEDIEQEVVPLTAAAIEEELGALEQIEGEEPQYISVKHRGRRQLVHVQSTEEKLGLNWLVVIIIPEADFLGPIYSSARFTSILTIIITGIAITLGLLAANWIVRPVQRLNKAAQDIRLDQFEPGSLDGTVSRTDELGDLAQVFQDMGTVIVAREASLTEQMTELRSEIDSAKSLRSSGRKLDGTYLKSLQAKAKRLREKEQ